MKKEILKRSSVWYFAALLALSLFCFNQPSFAQSYQQGDLVEVEWKNSWYKAQILEAGDGKYKIRYDGYSESWDEWVDNSRIRARGSSSNTSSNESDGKNIQDQNSSEKDESSGASGSSALPAGKYSCGVYLSFFTLTQYILLEGDGTYTTLKTNGEKRGSGKYSYKSGSSRIEFSGNLSTWVGRPKSETGFYLTQKADLDKSEYEQNQKSQTCNLSKK